MAVLGSFEEGLGGYPSLLITKGLIDGMMSVAMAASLGFGVMLSANQPMFAVWGPERSLLYNDGYAEILGNAVSPDCRGMGLGKAQYLFVLDRMREEGAKYVSVTTGGDDGHAPARRAYESVGFKAFTPSRTYRMKL